MLVKWISAHHDILQQKNNMSIRTPCKHYNERAKLFWSNGYQNTKQYYNERAKLCMP